MSPNKKRENKLVTTIVSITANTEIMPHFNPFSFLSKNGSKKEMRKNSVNQLDGTTAPFREGIIPFSMTGYKFLGSRSGISNITMTRSNIITTGTRNSALLAITSSLLGNPNIIIRDGVMDRKLLTKNKLDVNQVLSILRQNNVFSVREVKYGILEANGQISLLLKSKYQKPDKQDLNLPESPVDLPTSLIIDGEILWDNLHELGFDQQWLDNQLTTNGYDNVKRILYADWRESEGIHVSPK